MSFSRDDIESIVRNFYINPNQQDYQHVKEWYNINLSRNNEHTPFLTCIYLFLVGANMKNRYDDYDEDMHRAYITKVRDLTQQQDPESLIRKGYFDFGVGRKIYK